MPKSLGELAFERYKKIQNGRGHSGKKLGKWSELSEELQDEWERAAHQFGQAKTIIQAEREKRPSGR